MTVKTILMPPSTQPASNMTEPTDNEIDALVAAYLGDCGPQATRVYSFARAVLAKWGTLRAEKIVIPTDTMEQEFQKHYRRGYEAGKKAAAQAAETPGGGIPMRSTRLGLMQRVSATRSPMPNFGKAGLRDNVGKLAYLLSRNGLR